MDLNVPHLLYVLVWFIIVALVFSSSLRLKDIFYAPKMT